MDMADEAGPAPDESVPTEGTSETAANSAARSAFDQLGYVLSLPERVLRSGTGLVGGMARESAALLVPQSFQTSRTYTAMVQQMLDFLVHDVGGVAAGDQPSSTAGIDNYVARKAVGNFVDMASLATLHISPLVILAAISDVAYGSQVYLQELADELRAQGVIDQQTPIDHINDLLGAVSEATAATGKVFNTPPLSVEALKQTIDETRAAITSPRGGQVPDQVEVDRLWQEMREISAREGVGMLAVGGATTMRSMNKFATIGRGALSTVKVAGSLFDRHVLDHYAHALDEIREKGFYSSLSETSQPYLAAVWTNFQADKATLTEEVVSGRLLGTGWRTVRKWLGSESQPAGEALKPDEPPSPNSAK